ncbi:hypothetical protein JCGZ_19999 [Jatropha curcas]|uniref:Aminotransferase-like plant mobile domain-containing protein n=1 Tax=Jatropha curcas TaxID=180498 RepID=A0A067K7G3_JATCU|nr:hypothetical protein JCGZ_19999 [Jatropha curcas]
MSRAGCAAFNLSQVGSFDWATLGLAHLYHSLDVWTRGSGESNWLFIWPLEEWSYEYCIYPGGPSEVAELPTRSRLLMRGYWADRYFLGERVFDTPVVPAWPRVPHAPPRHMCLLEGLTREDLEVEYRGFSANDFLSIGDFPSYFASRMQARLPEVLEYTQERKTHKTAAHYRAEVVAEAGGAAAPVGPAGIVLGDVPAQRYQEICQRFGFARSYIDQLYSERHELAPPSPSPSAAAGPSRRRR